MISSRETFGREAAIAGRAAGHDAIGAVSAPDERQVGRAGWAQPLAQPETWTVAPRPRSRGPPRRSARHRRAPGSRPLAQAGVPGQAENGEARIACIDDEAEAARLAEERRAIMPRRRPAAAGRG